MKINSYKFIYLKKIALVILISWIFLPSSAQESQLSHYMFNTQVYNPGNAGSRNVFSVTALQRLGLIGFQGGPSTSLLALSTPVLNDQAGAGLSFVQDRLGANTATYVYADFAYKLQVTKKGTLAFGIKAGVSQLRSDLSQLVKSSPENIASIRTSFNPNIGTGIQFSLPHFFVGVA